MRKILYVSTTNTDESWDRELEFNKVTVYEAIEPEKTGLLDAQGNPLIRQKAKLGFDLG
jgi:hypothetical protein